MVLYGLKCVLRTRRSTVTWIGDHACSDARDPPLRGAQANRKTELTAPKCGPKQIPRTQGTSRHLGRAVPATMLQGMLYGGTSAPPRSGDLYIADFFCRTTPSSACEQPNAHCLCTLVLSLGTGYSISYSDRQTGAHLSAIS